MYLIKKLLNLIFKNLLDPSPLPLNIIKNKIIKYKSFYTNNDFEIKNFGELNKIVHYLKKKKAFFILLQCTSSYPVKLENVGLNVMHEYRDKFKCLVGLSDHTGTIYPSIYTVSHGFSLIEFHVAFHKKMFGPDSSSSLDPSQIDELQRIIQNINCLRNNPINKDKVSSKISRFKRIFGKSVALKRSLKKA